MQGLKNGYFVSCFLLCFISSVSYSQSELISWSSVKFTDQITDRVKFHIEPIIRHNQDLKSYASSSVDLLMSYKFSSQWSVSFLNRYWWMSNGTNRDFWFVQVNHNYKANDKLAITNAIRFHQAFDIDFEDPDFVRWLITFKFPIHEKITPFFASDIFFRINGFNEIQRTRFKVGANYKISDMLSFNLQLWKQDNINPSNPGSMYMIVPTLGYKIK